MIRRLKRMSPLLSGLVIVIVLAVLIWEDSLHLTRESKAVTSRTGPPTLLLSGTSPTRNIPEFDSHENFDKQTNYITHIVDSSSHLNRNNPDHHNSIVMDVKKDSAIKIVPNDKKTSTKTSHQYQNKAVDDKNKEKSRISQKHKSATSYKTNKPIVFNEQKLSKTSPPSSNKNTHLQQKPRERYIIYVCDKTTYCYGLGDRQRSVASLYILSVVTNRTFGVIWTQPCPLTKFFGPNEVNWDIPPSKLQGKSSIHIENIKYKINLNLTLPFDQQYPYDVIYIKSNFNYLYALRKHPFYRPKLPTWALGRITYATGNAWKRLMMPQPTLRGQVNEMLVQIFQEQQIDNKIRQHVRASPICRQACDSLKQISETKLNKKKKNDTNEGRSVDRGENSDVNNIKTVSDCVSEIKSDKSLIFPKGYFDSNSYLNVDNTSKNNNNISNSLVTPQNLDIFCKTGFNIGLPDSSVNNSNSNKKDNQNNINNLSVEAIRKSKGYEVVDLNIVCIHARIGRSVDLPFDKIRNSMNSTKALWEFARPYVEKGQHLYTATDYDKVRRDAKAQFGIRAHSATAPVVHIATVLKNQNETQGMALALWEQLLLMTSCKTFVQSHSGFSIIAGSVRDHIIGNSEKYLFNGGIVKQIR